MKKLNFLALCSGLCLACTPLVAMQPETVAPAPQAPATVSPAQASSDKGLLSAKVYEQRAREFLTKVVGEPDSFSLEEAKYNLLSQFKEYLNKRISIASMLSKDLSQEAANTLEERVTEERILTSDVVFLFVLNHLDSDPVARFLYYFPLMVEENLTYGIRKKMSCRISDKIYDFEMEYAQSLQQVTEEEFDKRLAQITPNEREKMKFAESKVFAQVVLKLLPELQFHSGNYLVNSYNEVQAFDEKKKS